MTTEYQKLEREAERKSKHEAEREAIVYKTLEAGPKCLQKIKYPISRDTLVKQIIMLIKPSDEPRGYPLIIGEHGTGKTSLITLAVSGIKESKGVAYVDVPDECESEVIISQAMQKALGWSSVPVIDSEKRNYSSSLSISIETNRFAAVFLGQVLEQFSNAAIRYKREHQKVPVLMIDYANRLAQYRERLFDLIQDYAKRAPDNRITTVVFVSSEGRVPRRTMGMSVMFIVLFAR